MSVESDRCLEILEGRARRLAGTDSPSEVFRGLLDAAAGAAPRAAVFLVRQGQLRGWGSAGYDEKATALQRSYLAPATAGWAGHVLADPYAGPIARDGGADLDFGQPAATEAVVVPVRVKDKPIALVLLEREGGAEPWAPHGIALLATVARLRLELDLAQRRLASAFESSPGAHASPAVAARGEDEPEAPEAAVASVPRASEPPAHPSVAGAGTVAVAPAPVETQTAGGATDPRLDAARRYARLVATDIRLYNEESVVLGRRNGDLATRLADALARGKDTYVKRHGELGPAGLNVLREAYVAVLAGGDATLIPSRIFE